MTSPSAHWIQSTHSHSALTCRRFNMSSPILIFGGLFLAAIAICGTLEARSPSLPVEDVKLVDNENVIGPTDVDLFAGCRENVRSTKKDCREKSISRASFSR